MSSFQHSITGFGGRFLKLGGDLIGGSIGEKAAAGSGCAARSAGIAGMQAAAQVQRLNQKIQAQDWTRDINYRDQGTAICPNCHAETGGGKFCPGCGTALAAAPAAAVKFCTNCGTALGNNRFCGECGTPAGG